MKEIRLLISRRESIKRSLEDYIIQKPLLRVLRQFWQQDHSQTNLRVYYFEPGEMNLVFSKAEYI